MKALAIRTTQTQVKIAASFSANEDTTNQSTGPWLEWAKAKSA